MKVACCSAKPAIKVGNPGADIIFEGYFSSSVNFYGKIFEKLRFLKKFSNENFF